MNGEFAEWFKAQHGPREGGIRASDQVLRDDIQRGLRAAAELDRRTLWDEKRQSALYAWTARDNEIVGTR